MEIASAKIVFVGEAPGADEDEQGLPFVGRAGQLLTKIIKQWDLSEKRFTSAIFSNAVRPEIAIRCRMKSGYASLF